MSDQSQGRCSNGHDNPAGMSFCGTCGEQLAVNLASASVDEASTAIGAEPSDTGTTPTDNAKPMKSRLILGVLAIAVIAVIALSVVLLLRRSNEPAQVEKAAEECGVEENLGDDGTSITFDTKGEDDLSGDGVVDVACVLLSLGAPDRVISQIDQTRALDGTVEASWDDYEAFWNYHPDSGLNLTVYVP